MQHFATRRNGVVAAQPGQARSGQACCAIDCRKIILATNIAESSITINGISLTMFDMTKNSFRVAIIPYTFEHTNMQYLSIGDEVNIEFDMIGKYINRLMELK